MAFKKLKPEDRKDKRYEFRINIPLSAGGGQFYKIKEFNNAQDAKDWHDEKQVELRRKGGAAATSNTLVRDYLDAMLAGRDLGPNARKTYGNSVRIHIKPRIGHLKVGDLEDAGGLLQGHFKEIGIQRPNPSGHKKLIGGPNARHTAESLVREMLGKLVDDKVLDRNPLAGVKAFPRPKPKQGKGIYAPSMTECYRAYVLMLNMVKGFPKHSHLQKVFIHLLMVGCGLRIGEAVAVTWSDFDQRSRTLTIDRQLIYLPEYGCFFAPPKKGGDGEPSYRTVVVPAFVWDALIELRTVLGAGKEFTLPWKDPAEPSLGTQTHRLLLHALKGDGPYTPNSVQMRVRALGRAIKAKRDLAPHAFRHAYTQQLRRAQVLDVDVDYLTGHTTKGSTSVEIYGGESTAKGRAKARAAIQEAWERAAAGLEEPDEDEVFEVIEFDD